MTCAGWTRRCFPIISYALMSDSTSLVCATAILRSTRSCHCFRRFPASRASTCRAARRPRWRCWPTRTGWQAYGLSMTDLSDALAKGNVLQAVGRLQDNHKLYLVMADHSIWQDRGCRRRRDALRPGRSGAGARRRRRSRTASCRNGSASERTARPPCYSMSMSSRTATPCRSPRAVRAKACRIQAAARRAAGELVRPEQAGHAIGRQRARRGADRPRARRAGADRVPAQLARDADRACSSFPRRSRRTSWCSACSA